MSNRATETIRIGLIDDDISVRRAVSRLLRSHDYACCSYESAENAFADPGLPQMHCLVVDIQLAGMSGFALRDRLRQEGSPIPTIFITAHSDIGSPEWARAIGDSPCVIKPFDESQLLRAIHQLIGGAAPSSTP